MNIISKLNIIENNLALINIDIKQNQSFSYKDGYKLNLYINIALEILNEMNLDTHLIQKNWQEVQYILQLKTVHSEIEKIRENLLKLNGSNLFTKKIEQTSPIIEDKIQQKVQSVRSAYRFPYSEGSEFAQFLEQVKAQFELAYPNDTLYAEKEFFHLLGNSFDKEKVTKKINTDNYEGSFQIYSIVSWSHIITHFVNENKELKCLIGSNLLSIIQKAILFSLKTSYVFKLQTKRLLNEELKENSYYRDFIEYSKNKDVNPQSVSSFLQKYTLNHSQNIPIKILYQDIAHDMKESIHHMQPSQSRIFVLGIYFHSITVQVTCLEIPSKFNPKGNYLYKIFNTGNGVEYHHQKIENKKIQIKPIVYGDIPLHAFSFDFIFKLVSLNFKIKSSVAEFYQLHDGAFTKEGGKKDFFSGSWYTMQQFGTCVYSSVEAWIDSYLNEDQIRHLELIKAKLSTSKQKKVVQIHEKEMNQAKLNNTNI